VTFAKDAVFESIDVEVLYEVIVNLHKQHVDDWIIKHFGYELPEANVKPWDDLIIVLSILKVKSISL
jgi:CTP synthase